MAERWQQWMPFHIDRFRGSPEVQAMHPSARIGFLYLLASAWQTDDCTISADPLDLATESGLGDDLWAQYGGRILRKFKFVDGRYRNEVVFEEWSDAKAVYDKRKAGAVRTNSVRSPNAERTQSERNTDTVTTTGTGTTTEELKKPLASTALAVPASPVAFTIHLTRGKTHLVTEDDVMRAEHAFPAVDVRQELRTMVEWLDAHPEKRSYSPKGARSRIVNWMSAKQDKGGSRGTQQPNRNYSKTGGNIDAARGALAILEQVERDSQAADEVQSETGGGGESGDLSHLRTGSITV